MEFNSSSTAAAETPRFTSSRLRFEPAASLKVSSTGSGGGDLVISVVNDTLRARFGPEFVGRLEPVQFDTFRAVWDNPARGTNYLNFTIDLMRRAGTADLYLWVPAHFTRVP